MAELFQVLDWMNNIMHIKKKKNGLNITDQILLKETIKNKRKYFWTYFFVRDSLNWMLSNLVVSLNLDKLLMGKHTNLKSLLFFFLLHIKHKDLMKNSLNNIKVLKS